MRHDRARPVRLPMKLKLLSAISVLCLAASMQATMTPRLTLEEMVERSERIVQGRCLRSWSAWDADHQFIWTHCEIQVSDNLKGGPVSTMVVSEPGGAVDGTELLIAGMPRHQPGEEMVLFLYRTPIGFWRARGLGQGKFSVRADAPGSRRVRADLYGAVLVEPAGAGVRTGADLLRLDEMPLEEFKSKVREMASRPARGAR